MSERNGPRNTLFGLLLTTASAFLPHRPRWLKTLPAQLPLALLSSRSKSWMARLQRVAP